MTTTTNGSGWGWQRLGERLLAAPDWALGAAAMASLVFAAFYPWPATAMTLLGLAWFHSVAFWTARIGRASAVAEVDGALAAILTQFMTALMPALGAAVATLTGTGTGRPTPQPNPVRVPVPPPGFPWDIRPVSPQPHPHRVVPLAGSEQAPPDSRADHDPPHAPARSEYETFQAVVNQAFADVAAARCAPAEAGPPCPSSSCPPGSAHVLGSLLCAACPVGAGGQGEGQEGQEGQDEADVLAAATGSARRRRR